jgi:hypothetical protein
VAARRGSKKMLWRVRPTEVRILDSVEIEGSPRGPTAQVGDRIYFGSDNALIGVSERPLQVVSRISLGDRVVALAGTPSGDRIFVATAGQRQLSIFNRYTGEAAGSVSLPGLVAELRMDALGRYLLAKPTKGDSAWVIAIGTGSLIGTIETKWTHDLPVVAPDGAIAAVEGNDVVFLDGESLQTVRTVTDGANDYWFFFFWNGFRPRSAGLDRKVEFADPDTMPSVTPPPRETTRVADTSRPSPIRTQPVDSTPAPPTRGTGYLVSFAAMLSEDRAKALAASITVNNTHPKVVASERSGTKIYRVVLGPYRTKEEAERVGKESNRQFWVYGEGS